MNRPNPQRGFSLLEVIIGIIILGVASTTLLFASRTAVTGQLRSKAYGDAATATREALESIQLLTLDSVSRLKNAPVPHSQGPLVAVEATTSLLAAADVANLNALDTTTLRRLTLKTRFKNKAGQDVVKTFNTILYKP